MAKYLRIHVIWVPAALILAASFGALQSTASESEVEVHKDSTILLAGQPLLGDAFALGDEKLPGTSKAPKAAEERPAGYRELLARAKRRKGSVRVIVGLKMGFRPEGKLTRPRVERQRSKIKALQRKALAKVTTTKTTSIRRYRFIPYLAMKADAATLKKLNSAPEVDSIKEDVRMRLQLADSTPLIGAPQAWGAGYSGSGQTVAVIDTGIDKDHPFLAGKVVAEACYSSGCPQDNQQGAYEDAGVPCSGASVCAHGTHVAGIAAGNGEDLEGVGFSGVAKDADLISVRLWPETGGLEAFQSNVLAGLEQVYAWRTRFNIASVNMSLGWGMYESSCDDAFPSFKSAIDNLRSFHVATVVAAGNDMGLNGIGSPACISTAISVGSTTISDEVSGFSNRAGFMDFYAPGEEITSSIPEDTPSDLDDDYDTKSGTSMAAPHVAGAWAVLKSRLPDASVEHVKSSLRDTGEPIYDEPSGTTKPRIQVDKALDWAGLPQQSGNVDLLQQANVELDGASVGTYGDDLTGYSVADAGDVNGDDVPDIIVGVPFADNNDRTDSGSAYIVFGSSSTEPVDLADLGDRGFRIDGAAYGDRAGYSVSSVGDLNDDGLAEIVVGAPGASYGGMGSGAAYVVFGSPSIESVDLADLGDRGFRIDGAAEGDQAGLSVGGTGDINDDGRADIVVGAPYSGQEAYEDDSGSAYVVFGRPSTQAIDLADLGEGGYRIEAFFINAESGRSVANAGDVNSDGYSDLVVGNPGAGSDERLDSGAAYVSFGRDLLGTVMLQRLGESLDQSGFRIEGAEAGDQAGYSVSEAGDVDGDGIEDLIIGAPSADRGDSSEAGAAYVVFGRPATVPRGSVDLGNLGSEGFKIEGASEDGQAGFSVSYVDDLNGDGRSELLVGAPGVSSGEGAAYLVFGRPGTTTVDLGNLDGDGFRIEGSSEGDRAGFSVSGTGDLNRDRRSEILIGAPGADSSGNEDSGAAYLLFGRSSTATISLGNLRGRGFEIEGASEGDRAGTSVSGAGNLNGDRRPDLIIGAPEADREGRDNSGAAYAVFGKSSRKTVRLARIGERSGKHGYRMDGARENAYAGSSVAGAGDPNGDGRDDLFLGAPGASSEGRDGGAYLLYGFGEPSLTYRPRLLRLRVGVPMTPLEPRVQRTGETSYTVTPELPEGLTLNPYTGVISGTPTSPSRRTTRHKVRMRDLTGTASERIRIRVRAR